MRQNIDNEELLPSKFGLHDQPEFIPSDIENQQSMDIVGRWKYPSNLHQIMEFGFRHDLIPNIQRHFCRLVAT